ncbi:TonB-dependent receptor [Vibrio sp.]|uniref:TonB-dependent receptor n=1 Tax=Vibrio viridaestus TaxID=2487322 RepID=A0A3N9TBI4_9VIBR|nr:TonB-dependent receptor [Vibrio viridaestus]MDC0611218.1 TonB-dependent receptor [Vibrio sp.]RQW61481.1 TonB-dependent receptor [Vibrio viridaestus]
MKLLNLSCAVALALAANSAIAADDADTTSKSDTSDVVVVTATTNETSLKDAPASVSVVTNEEINRIPATDVATVLQGVAGVYVSKDMSSEPRIVIRGLKNDASSHDNYTLLLVNGKRINSSETLIRGAGFDFSSIPMSAIDHIEVIRGPMSALYGSDAIGGVVNVILKKPTEDTQVNASVSYSQPEEGDGTLKKANAFLSGAAVPGKLLYTTSIEASQQDKWFPDNIQNDNNFTGNAQQKRQGINTQLTWLANEDNTVNFGLGYLKDDRTFPDSDKYDTSDDDIYNSKKFNASLGHEGTWDWGTDTVDYLYENSKVYVDNSNSLLTIANAEQQNHNLDARVAVTAIDQQTITTGMNLEYTSISIDRDYDGTPSVTKTGYYLQDQIGITDDLTATLSGRLNHHSQFGSKFTPRAYLVYSATDNLTLKGGYAEGFKAPTIYQSSEQFGIVSCGGTCTLTGNPDLKPEESKSYEFSAAYNAQSWNVQATVFFNQVENMIDRDTSTRSSGYITYKNITDDVETRGVELEGSFDITDSLYLKSNATYTRAINTEDNSELENNPRWLINTTLNWVATDDLSLYTGVNYTGKQYGMSYAENYNNIWYDPYTIVDVGGSYRINNQFTVKAGVNNVLDKNLEDDDQDYSENIVGRTYFLTLDYAM